MKIVEIWNNFKIYFVDIISKIGFPVIVGFKNWRILRQQKNTRQQIHSNGKGAITS